MAEAFGSLLPQKADGLRVLEAKMLLTLKTNTIKVNPTGQSLVAAKNSAVSGDTVEVFPGSYTVAQDDQLFKDGVNWFFYPGATVTKTNTRTDAASGLAYGIFDDRASGAVTCRIAGYGEFVYDAGMSTPDLVNGLQANGNSNIKGAIVVTNASSDVRVNVARVKVRAYTNNIYVAPVYVANCTMVQFQGDEALDYGFAPLDVGFSPGLGTDLIVNSTVTGPYWEAGETYVNIKHIKTYIYGIYAVQTGTSQTSLWVSAELIETSAPNSIYILGDAAQATSNWRTWITCKEVRGAYIAYNTGKHYLMADKLSGITNNAMIFQTSTTGFEVWANVQKVSATGGSFVAMNAGGGNLGTVYLTVQHFEDTGTATPGLSINRGKIYVFGGQMQILNGVGVQVGNAAATAILQGLRIDTSNTNNAANLPVSIVAAGTLVLNGCTLIAPALADSIKGDIARTVKNYGCVANKDKNTNITLSPNAGFTVDTLVV